MEAFLQVMFKITTYQSVILDNNEIINVDQNNHENMPSWLGD